MSWIIKFNCAGNCWEALEKEDLVELWRSEAWIARTAVSKRIKNLRAEAYKREGEISSLRTRHQFQYANTLAEELKAVRVEIANLEWGLVQLDSFYRAFSPEKVVRNHEFIYSEELRVISERLMQSETMLKWIEPVLREIKNSPIIINPSLKPKK